MTKGPSYSQNMKMGWDLIRSAGKDHPDQIFPKFEKKDFEKLKQEYNEKYGYTIRIPQISDIIQVVPDFMKTPEEIKLEKKQNLTRILDSPSYAWSRTYSSIMTWIDNIQDTQSVVYPLLWAATKAFPKAMGKLLPVIGWLTAGYDILNLMNAVGRAPLTAMKSKRAICQFKKQNPFGFWARYERNHNIRNWKPNVADAIQQAQVLHDVTGAGLSLGPIMGTIMDAALGAWRYLNGEKVRVTMDPPSPSNLEHLGMRGMRSAANISTQGQTFDELTHFWTYITYMLSLMACGQFCMDSGVSELIENPMDIALEADRPTNPNTIAVIQEAGLSIEDGIGWPYNGEKIISAGDLIDAQAEPIQSNFWQYCIRHQYDSYGMIAGGAIHYVNTHVFKAIDPGSELKMDDSDLMKVFWKMVKAPLLPAAPPTPEQGTKFEFWIIDYKDKIGALPGIIAIKEFLNSIGMQTIDSYPLEPGQDYENYFEGTAWIDQLF